jgi:hypothetical protein
MGEQREGAPEYGRCCPYGPGTGHVCMPEDKPSSPSLPPREAGQEKLEMVGQNSLEVAPERVGGLTEGEMRRRIQNEPLLYAAYTLGRQSAADRLAALERRVEDAETDLAWERDVIGKCLAAERDEAEADAAVLRARMADAAGVLREIAAATYTGGPFYAKERLLRVIESLSSPPPGPSTTD